MPESLAEPRWATIAQAAEYLNVPERTMRRWVETGVVPAFRLGPRRIQLDLNAVDKLRKPLAGAR